MPPLTWHGVDWDRTAQNGFHENAAGIVPVR
jgi:hypothetical protein